MYGNYPFFTKTNVDDTIEFVNNHYKDGIVKDAMNSALEWVLKVLDKPIDNRSAVPIEKSDVKSLCNAAALAQERHDAEIAKKNFVAAVRWLYTYQALNDYCAAYRKQAAIIPR